MNLDYELVEMAYYSFHSRDYDFFTFLGKINSAFPLTQTPRYLQLHFILLVHVDILREDTASRL